MVFRPGYNENQEILYTKGVGTLILAVAISNIHVTIALFEENGDIRFRSELETERRYSEDRCALDLMGLFQLYGGHMNEVQGAIVSSVVPPITDIFVRAIQRLTGKRPLVVGPGVKTGLNIRADVHNQLGSNIVASAVAAVALYPSPSIVINSGTALSFSYMRQASYEGCAIMPGMAIALEALSDNGAQLPHIAMGKVDTPLGRNTVDSMRAGVVYGYAGTIDRLVDEMEQAAGETAASVVSTGEYAPEIFRHCRHSIEYDRDLMVKGLYFLYRKNTTKRTR